MSKLVIYPYTGNEIYLIDFFQEQGFEVIPVSLNGFSLNNKAATYRLNRESKYYIKCIDNLDLALDQCDTIYLCKTKYYDKFINALVKARENHINVICANELKTDDYNKYINDITYLPKNENLQFEDKLVYEKIYEFYTPIVFINSLINDSDEVDILFKFIRKLKEQGLHISGISNSIDTSLLKLHSYKECGFSDKIDVKSIFSLNHFIKYINDLENPDIIVIHHPEPIVMYNKEYPFDFGLSAYAISHALSPDYCICCSYLATSNIEYWNEFNNANRYRLGYEVNAVHLSNTIADIGNINDHVSSKTIRIPVDSSLREYEIMDDSNNLYISYLLDDNQMEKTVDRCLHTVKNDSNIILI